MSKNPTAIALRTRTMRKHLSLLLLASAGITGAAIAQAPPAPVATPPAVQESLDAPAPHGVRRGGTLAQEFEAPRIAPEVRAMARPARNYPEQPPVIPHSIRDYQVDKNFNMCLTCHSRSAAEFSEAPMISVTHFRDRDGQVLAAVAPNRYFCLQCHVPQTTAAPIRGNTFKSIDQVLQEVISERQPQRGQ